MGPTEAALGFASELAKLGATGNIEIRMPWRTFEMFSSEAMRLRRFGVWPIGERFQLRIEGPMGAIFLLPMPRGVGERCQYCNTKQLAGEMSCQNCGAPRG
jgi:hypothetical protein